MLLTSKLFICLVTSLDFPRMLSAPLAAFHTQRDTIRFCEREWKPPLSHLSKNLIYPSHAMFIAFFSLALNFVPLSSFYYRKKLSSSHIRLICDKLMLLTHLTLSLSLSPLDHVTPITCNFFNFFFVKKLFLLFSQEGIFKSTLHPKGFSFTAMYTFFLCKYYISFTFKLCDS